MNLYEASIGEGARTVKIGSQEIELPPAVPVARPALAEYAGKAVVVGLRPEHLPAAGPGVTGPQLQGDIDLVEALGSELVIHFTLDAKRVRAEGAVSEDAATISGEGVARVDPRTPAKAGEKITFAVNTEGMQFFDPDSGAAIWA
jgi:multiple sugar transport system ATP-binding protein